jgi:hypothetical protein
MPNSMINKDAREGKGSKKSLEHKWNKAKDAAGKKDGEQNWALTNYIYQQEKKASTIKTNATARLKATARSK